MGNEEDTCEQLHNRTTFIGSPTALGLPLHVTKPLTICSIESVSSYVRTYINYKSEKILYRD